MSAARRQRDATEPLFSSFNSPTNLSAPLCFATCRFGIHGGRTNFQAQRCLLTLPFRTFPIRFREDIIKNKDSELTPCSRSSFLRKASSSLHDPRNEQHDPHGRANPPEIRSHRSAVSSFADWPTTKTETQRNIVGLVGLLKGGHRLQ